MNIGFTDTPVQFSGQQIFSRLCRKQTKIPSQPALLADKNALDFMHYETLMFSLTHLFYRLQEEMI